MQRIERFNYFEERLKELYSLFDIKFCSNSQRSRIINEEINSTFELLCNALAGVELGITDLNSPSKELLDKSQDISSRILNLDFNMVTVEDPDGITLVGKNTVFKLRKNLMWWIRNTRNFTTHGGLPLLREPSDVPIGLAGATMLRDLYFAITGISVEHTRNTIPLPSIIDLREPLKKINISVKEDLIQFSTPMVIYVKNFKDKEGKRSSTLEFFSTHMNVKTAVTLGNIMDL